MPGSNAEMVVQPRDLVLLHEVDRLRVLDREDARILAPFGSRTRANARLLTLTQAGLLTKKAAGTIRGGRKFLYALSPQGARLIGGRYRAPLWQPHTTFAWSEALEHQVAVNRVYLGLRAWSTSGAVRVEQWRTFPAPLSPHHRLRPDAYFELTAPAGTRAIFLEVDRGTETRRIWDQKVAAYVALATSGAFTALFNQPQFRVAVTAPSLRRLNGLRAWVAARTEKLFWFAVLPHAQDEWMSARIWMRPRSDDSQFLI